MPVDTSIYSQQPETQFNPMQAYSGGIGIANSMQQNKLLQLAQQKDAMQNQLLQAQIDAGQTLAKYTDPQTGIVDYNAATADAAGRGNPLIHSMVMEGADANAPQQVMGRDADGNPVPQYYSRQNLAAQLQPRLKSAGIDDPQAHLDDVQTTLAGLRNKPDCSIGDVCDAVGSLVANQRIKPSEAAIEMTNLPYGPNGEPPATPQIHQYLDNQIGRVQQTQRKLQQLQGMSLQAGVPLGTEGDTSAALARKDQYVKEANAATATNQSLQKLYDLSEEGVETGPTEAWKNKAKSYLADVGVGTDKLANDSALYSEFQKYASRALLTGGMPGSDERLHQLQSGNVNGTMLPQAVRDLARSAMAQNQGAIAKSTALQNHMGQSKDPVKQTQFENQWNQNFDMRAFEVSQLPKDQQSKYFSALPPPERDQVLKNYLALKKLGAFQ